MIFQTTHFCFDVLAFALLDLFIFSNNLLFFSHSSWLSIFLKITHLINFNCFLLSDYREFLRSCSFFSFIPLESFLFSILWYHKITTFLSPFLNFFISQWLFLLNTIQRANKTRQEFKNSRRISKNLDLNRSNILIGKQILSTFDSQNFKNITIPFPLHHPDFPLNWIQTSDYP